MNVRITYILLTYYFCVFTMNSIPKCFKDTCTFLHKELEKYTGFYATFIRAFKDNSCQLNCYCEFCIKMRSTKQYCMLTQECLDNANISIEEYENNIININKLIGICTYNSLQEYITKYDLLFAQMEQKSLEIEDFYRKNCAEILQKEKQQLCELMK